MAHRFEAIRPTCCPYQPTLGAGDYQLGLKEAADYPGVYYRQRNGHTVIGPKTDWQINLYFRPPSWAGKDPFGHVWADFTTLDIDKATKVCRHRASIVGLPKAMGLAILGHDVDHSDGKIAMRTSKGYQNEVYGADYAVTINLKSKQQLDIIAQTWTQKLKQQKYNLYRNNCMNMLDDFIQLLQAQKLLKPADLAIIDTRRNDSILVPGSTMQKMRVSLGPVV